MSSRAEMRAMMRKARGVRSGSIVSPLARYLKGNLVCLICKTVVPSDDAWPGHIVSASHKQKMVNAKRKLAKPAAAPKPAAGPPPGFFDTPAPAPAPAAAPSVPAGFFDAGAAPAPAPAPAPTAPSVPAGFFDSGSAPSPAPAPVASTVPAGFFDAGKSSSSRAASPPKRASVVSAAAAAEASMTGRPATFVGADTTSGRRRDADEEVTDNAGPAPSVAMPTQFFDGAKEEAMEAELLELEAEAEKVKEEEFVELSDEAIEELVAEREVQAVMEQYEYQERLAKMLRAAHKAEEGEKPQLRPVAVEQPPAKRQRVEVPVDAGSKESDSDNDSDEEGTRTTEEEADDTGAGLTAGELLSMMRTKRSDGIAGMDGGGGGGGGGDESNDDSDEESSSEDEDALLGLNWRNKTFG